MCRRLPLAAFLASRLLNHSRFPAGRAHGFAAPLRVALGLRPKCPQGTRFPSRLWTLETLARSGGGGGPHPWRERWARGRAYRGGSGRMQRGFCRLGQGAWPGGDSRRVRGDAFLAPFRRSQRSRRLRSPQRRPMPQRAVKGQGPFDISERRPSPYRAQRGRPLTAAVRAKQLFTQKRLTRRKDGAIIPASNAEGGRAGMKAARMDHSSAYYFTFSFTFARKALLRCAV